MTAATRRARAFQDHEAVGIGVGRSRGVIDPVPLAPCAWMVIGKPRVTGQPRMDLGEIYR